MPEQPLVKEKNNYVLYVAFCCKIIDKNKHILAKTSAIEYIKYVVYYAYYSGHIRPAYNDHGRSNIIISIWIAGI